MFLATDVALQQRVEHLIVQEGRSAREAARTIGCDRGTVLAVLSNLGITSSARNNAARDALILSLADKGTPISAIARETGITRRGVRRVIEAAANDNRAPMRRLPKSRKEQDVLALAALHEAYPGESYRDVADDREPGPRSRVGLHLLTTALDNGPPPGRVVPPPPSADLDEDEDDEIVALHENDGLSPRQIANLIGETESRVSEVLQREREVRLLLAA